jgi:hypothetical protein
VFCPAPFHDSFIEPHQAAQCDKPVALALSFMSLFFFSISGSPLCACAAPLQIGIPSARIQIWLPPPRLIRQRGALSNRNTPLAVLAQAAQHSNQNSLSAPTQATRRASKSGSPLSAPDQAAQHATFVMLPEMTQLPRCACLLAPVHGLTGVNEGSG